MVAKASAVVCIIIAGIMSGGCTVCADKADSLRGFCEVTRNHIKMPGKLIVEAEAVLTPHYEILLQRPECPKSGALLFISDELSKDANVKRLTTELASTWSNGGHLKVRFEGKFNPGKEVGEPNAFILLRVLAIGKRAEP